MGKSASAQKSTSPTPTPTLPPGGTAVAVTPEANAVGYVRSYDPRDERNHFGEADMYVGIWGGFNIHVGAVQFDLSAIHPQPISTRPL